MDRRLFEAAWMGNVEYLLKLIEDDPSTLHAVALDGGETPLHVACMAGHLDFVREVLILKKEFARELNQNGFRPLDIASANGDVEMVKELLKIDCNLCQLEGRERRIPLHYAVMKGRADVVIELLSACEVSIQSMTVRGETCFHLAVKNNQFEVFKLLVDHLKQFNKEDVLNEKDDHGNTILHLAVSRKQYQVIDFVLNETVVTKGILEVNSLNKKALTPLDVLLLFQSEAGDREIEHILKRAGALRTEDLHDLIHGHVAQESIANDINNPSTTNEARSPNERLQEYFKYHNIADSPAELRNCLLVIAILIATATYQAVLSPPGGVWQDDIALGSNNVNNTTSNTTIKPHIAGQTIMGSYNSLAYKLFLIFNSIGFFMSLHMIHFLTVGFPMRLELEISIIALIVTYDTCMTAIAPFMSYFFTAVSIALPIGIPVATMLLRNHMRRRSCRPPRTNQTSV